MARLDNDLDLVHHANGRNRVVAGFYFLRNTAVSYGLNPVDSSLSVEVGSRIFSCGAVSEHASAYMSGITKSSTVRGLLG